METYTSHYQREYFAKKNAKRKLNHFKSEALSFIGAVILIGLFVEVCLRIIFNQI